MCKQKQRNERDQTQVDNRIQRIANILAKRAPSTHPNDKEYMNFLKNNGLIQVDKLFTQKTTKTFKSAQGESWIDHVLIDSKRLLTEMVQVNVLNTSEANEPDGDEKESWDPLNASDHLATTVELEINGNFDEISKKDTSIGEPRVNWLSEVEKQEYRNQMNKNKETFLVDELRKKAETSPTTQNTENLLIAIHKCMDESSKWIINE